MAGSSPDLTPLPMDDVCHVFDQSCAADQFTIGRYGEQGFPYTYQCGNSVCWPLIGHSDLLNKPLPSSPTVFRGSGWQKKKKTGTAKWICAHSCIIRALIRESLLRSAGLMCVLCVLCVDPFSSLFFCKPLAGLDKPPVSHTTCLKKPQVNMNLPKRLDVVIVHYMQHSLSRHICQMNGSKVPRGDLIQLDMLVHSINKRTQLNPHLKEAEYFQILLW